MSTTANVFEVFSGIQGEGIYVGRRHLFVRFSGCNLSCLYCDTPEAREPSPFARIEQTPGGRDFRRLDNPFDPATLASWIEHLDGARRHDAVSLTGGEPLLAADHLAELLPRCGGRRFYLETNGTLPAELEKVIDLVHVVAMDIKLPWSGHAPDLAATREFLSVAARREVMVKVVAADRTRIDRVLDAALVTASVRRDIPFVIQPVTPTSPDVRPPGPADLLGLQMSVLEILDDVRVIPQVHRALGQK